MVRTTSLFVLIAVLSVASSVSVNYYNGFTKTLGIESFFKQGVNCKKPISEALNEFRDTVEEDFEDADLLLESVLDIIDRLKYEVSPMCRTLYGDFQTYMNKYYGNAKNLIMSAEDNLAANYQVVSSSLSSANDAVEVGQEYEAGVFHAQALRVLIGLPKNLQHIENKTQESQVSASKKRDEFIFQEYVNALAIMDDEGSDQISDKNKNKQSEGVLLSKISGLKRVANKI